MINRHLVRFLFVVLAALSGTQSLAQDAFPRLGGYLIGAPQNYEDPAYQLQMAKLDVVVLGVWPGWESGRGTTFEQVIRNIKSRNPQTRVFQYILNEAVTTNTSAYPEVQQKVREMSWWLYPTASCCSAVPSFWGGHNTINNTAFSPRDANGDRWIDWYAKWSVERYFKPNPSLDGFFTDNFFWKPRVDGDWNRDGVKDSAGDPTVQRWQREGLRQHVDLLRNLMPGKLQIGNTADWGASNANITEFRGALNGGVMEALLGYSYSPETWGSWGEMMAQYRRQIGAMASPRLAIFHQNGDPRNYQEFRYGFASCLMDDAYYYFSTDDSYHGVNWFDEFDAELGKAVSSPPTSAWSSGVFRRDFENGIVLVNPKGNGTRTVQLESEYRRVNGKQDPTTNNGQATRSVTLKDRDGIVLLRAVSLPRPLPPAGLQVE